jgi:hypothetical protein
MRTFNILFNIVYVAVVVTVIAQNYGGQIRDKVLLATAETARTAQADASK